MIRPILKVPAPELETRCVAAPWQGDASPAMNDLIGDLWDTMHAQYCFHCGRIQEDPRRAAPCDCWKPLIGVGLSANQIGVLQRVCVVDVTGLRCALVNPFLIKSKGKQVENEICFSQPGVRVPVLRATKIKVGAVVYYPYQEEKGHVLAWEVRQVEMQFVDKQARVVLHEMDHLDGVLIGRKANVAVATK
jgi:peptide deformylase